MKSINFWATILVLFLLVAAAIAADATNSTLTTPSLSPSLPVSSMPRGQLRTDAGSIISLIVLVVVGLAYCFSGFGLFKPTLFMSGFFLASNVTLLALSKSGAFASSNYSPTSVTLIYLAISIAAGLVGGSLLVCCWGIGVYVIGLLGGFVVGNMLLSAIQVQLALPVRIVIIIFCCIVGVALIHFFEKAIIVSATAVAGAYVTVLGLDMVLNRGIAYDMQHNEAPTLDSIYEVAGVLGLAFVGIIVQFMRNRHSTFGQAHPPPPQYGHGPYGKYP